MSIISDIQRRIGVTPDGIIGPATIAAIAKSLGIEPKKAAYTLHNPTVFFAAVRSGITNGLDQDQVDTINGLLAAASHWPVSWLAYGLATAWHEARLVPIAEIGKGRGRPYGCAGKFGQPQYGRGLVQLTWDRNYQWADRELGLDGKLLENFDLALDPQIATQILVKGMEQGAFTGKSLADFLPRDRASQPQFVAARRIINGTDRASLIAGYAIQFQNALVIGDWA